MAEDDDIEIFAILLGQFPHAALGVFHVRRVVGGRKPGFNRAQRG